MGGGAADDETECDDAVGLIAGDHGCDHCRNFEGAGHANQIDAGLWDEILNFLEGVVDQRVREFLVVFRGNDADADS